MKILDVGCGAVPKLKSDYLEIEVVACDSKAAPGVEFQDMEKLTYPDNLFDVVMCVNALDHTKDARAALHEMQRVSRGLIYINCALDQMTRHRKKHYWDAKADGKLVSPTETIDLRGYGFNIEFDDGRMIARKCVQS